ncbi:MAG TPA: PTS sugar transporter subunit IIA [Candidatus Fimivicinus intestinavium]|nr:PTS sugar transporter subunit IIA [Candidatus Fimivicinus intestinavium]
MLLKEIAQQNRAAFFPAASDWKDAIRKSCQPLVETGCATPAYAQRVIDCVEEFGPYIVIVPGLAIPHSTKGSPGVTQTAVSFVRFEQPVIFDPTDHEKDAHVFFALAAVDEDAHIKNMRQLFKILSNEELLEKLACVSSTQELIQLDEQYLGG